MIWAWPWTLSLRACDLPESGQRGKAPPNLREEETPMVPSSAVKRQAQRGHQSDGVGRGLCSQSRVPGALELTQLGNCSEPIPMSVGMGPTLRKVLLGP